MADAGGALGLGRLSHGELVAPVVELRAENARLRERIEELERRVNRNSANSSIPPSSDPPKSQAERRRRAREAYARSMRKTGGQPGHEGKTREMWTVLRRGGADRRSVLYQQYELPPARPLVFEHARVRLRCPGCGRPVLAELPGPAHSGYGPRLQAHIAMFAGVFRLSREQVRQIVSEVFGIPSSKSTIDNTLAQINAILANPWAELRDAVRRAEAVHLDETTWRLRGAQQWLWVAASALHACYRIDPSRSQKAAKALIGEEFGGFAIQQQLCWAHVIRQLVEISERGGATARRGAQLVKLAREVIAVQREYLEHGHEHRWLAERLAPLRQQIRALVEQCAHGRHQRRANFASGLLEEYDALWTFAEVPDAAIQPTNNTAERAMRHPVLMRAIQGGTQSDRGNRWIERIQSIRETCRLQDRGILDWLIAAAAAAAHHGQPIPSLTPT